MSDANFARYPQSKKSVSAYVVKLALERNQKQTASCCYKSIKQKTTALSTTEAEANAICEICKQLIYLKNIFGQLFPNKKLNITLLSDSTGAIAVCKHPTKHNTTKHFGIHC